MKRRSFLKLLALLPFVPKLAESAAKAVKPKFIDPLPAAKIIIQYNKALTDSDQTSLWLVNWSPHTFRQAGKSMTMMEVARYHQWNGLPVIEALNQRNSFSREWQDLSDYILPTRKA